ncbi:hypothetical protein [Bacillus taeanensis]|nr:hypothetical protein [Bacillus taeanensis]
MTKKQHNENKQQKTKFDVEFSSEQNAKKKYKKNDKQKKNTD